MKKVVSLFTLIKSLSKSEKRYVKLYGNLQNGEKSYLALFDIMNDNMSIEEVVRRFKSQQNGRNFDIAVNHLYEVVLQILVHTNNKQDVSMQVLKRLSNASVLVERELLEDAMHQLEKAEQLAIHYELDSYLLLIRRTQLKYLSLYNFPEMKEKEVVEKQMRVNETMHFSRSAIMHSQLYDILKYRYNCEGCIRSANQKANLNDLLLSELNLISNQIYKGFEMEKLHLLFQSTYMLYTNNYKAAIMLYQDLLTLFDNNRHMIQSPPIYYLNAIIGILDSLFAIGLYDDMPFFLDRLKEIERGDYSDEFLLMIHARIYLYEFYSLFNTGEFEKVAQLQKDNTGTVLEKVSLLDMKLQLELYLSLVVWSLAIGDITEARKQMKKILSAGKSFYIYHPYRVVRLVNLILQAETGNYDFFENEIKSIRRSYQSDKKEYVTEKYLFKFVQEYPLSKSKQQKLRAWQKYNFGIKELVMNNSERPLLKYFNFYAYIEGKLTDISFQEIMQKHNALIKANMR